MMTESMLVKEQFNKQAVNFDNWPVTKNEKILGSLFNFFEIGPDDRLLDFACGTGAFVIYAAQRVKAVQGVDISEKMIEIAEKSGKQNNLTNVEFLCCSVEKVPFENGSYDCVVSKSAFHHMRNYQAVFSEMKRCCKEKGRICLEDIILYDDKKLDEFFEELERKIDISHNSSMSKQEIINLYKQNGVRILRIFESISELNFFDYVNHAVQSRSTRSKIDCLLDVGLKDDQISQWFTTRNGTLFWKRKVFTIVGQRNGTLSTINLQRS